MTITTTSKNLCSRGHDLDAPRGRLTHRSNQCRICCVERSRRELKAQNDRIAKAIAIKNLPHEEGVHCRNGHILTPGNSIRFERDGKTIVNCRVCGRKRPRTHSTATDETWTLEILRLGDLRYLATPMERELIDKRLAWIDRQRRGKDKD